MTPSTDIRIETYPEDDQHHFSAVDKRPVLSWLDGRSTRPTGNRGQGTWVLFYLDPVDGEGVETYECSPNRVDDVDAALAEARRHLALITGR